MKRIISLLIALVMIIALPLHANAATSNTTDYFNIYPSNSRINEDGTFTADFGAQVRSKQNFIATSYRISLVATGQLYSEDPYARIYPDSVTYTISLYKVGLTNPVGSLTGTANGTPVSINFNVNTGAEYYFTVKPSENIGMFERIALNGDLSNIYVIYN